MQGQHGGRTAAQHFTKAIAAYLSNEDVQIFGRLSFWVNIYFNKLDLVERTVGNNLCTHEQLEAFLAVCSLDLMVGFDAIIFKGFSQSSPRFLLVDVGYGREAVDSKIKGIIRPPPRVPSFAYTKR